MVLHEQRDNCQHKHNFIKTLKLLCMDFNTHQ